MRLRQLLVPLLLAFSLDAFARTSPFLVGKDTFADLKNRMGAFFDDFHLSLDIGIFKIDTLANVEHFKRVVGSRFVRESDRLPLLLGFMVIQSVDLEDGFYLHPAKIITKNDLVGLPSPIWDLYRSMKNAKFKAKMYLPVQYKLYPYHFINTLVERMTHEKIEYANSPSNEHDSVDEVIFYLREAGPYLEQFLFELKYSGPL